MSKTGITAPMLTHLSGSVHHLALCYRLTLNSQQPIITNISQASNGVVTTLLPHSLVDDDTVKISDVLGMDALLDKFVTVTIISPTTFSIGIDTSFYAVYVSGGRARRTYGYINIDKDVIYDGVTYSALKGIIPSNIRIGTGNVINNMELLTAANAAFTVTETDIHAGRIDNAELESFFINYNDLTMGPIKMLSGNTGQVKLFRNHYVTEAASLSDALAQDTIEVVTPTCRNILGDEFEGLVSIGCTVDTSALAFSGTVTTVAGGQRRIFDDTSIIAATGYFKGGMLTWTSGNNVGTKIEIQRHNTDTIQLFEKTVFDIEVGDTYSMVPGCDLLKTTCITKFNNLLDFNGFDFLPGPSELSNVGGMREGDGG